MGSRPFPARDFPVAGMAELLGCCPMRGADHRVSMREVFVMSNDLNEENLLSMLAEVRRRDSRPLAIRPTQAVVPVCPTCGSVARYDEPYFMCDRCARVIGYRC